MDKILLALIPVFLAAPSWEKALQTGLAAVLSYGLTASLVFTGASLWGKKWIDFFILLILSLLALTGWLAFGLSPYWIASLYILGFYEGGLRGTAKRRALARVKPLQFKTLFLNTVLFFATLLLVTGLQEWMTAHFSLILFKTPAGFFLILGLLSFASRFVIMKNQDLSRTSWVNGFF